MSADKLDQLHEILKEPFRKKILLKLGEHNGLSFDELMKELKMDNREEVGTQLNVLGDLVSKTEYDEYLLSEQGVSKKPGGKYRLTEKGQDAVNEMVALPEIKSENYKEEINRKYFSQKAVSRRKLFYVLLGAGGGYAFFFLTGGVISIISAIRRLHLNQLQKWLATLWRYSFDCDDSRSVYWIFNWSYKEV